MSNASDAIAMLRQHHAAPCTLGELADLADRLLQAAGLPPDRPTTERTVRFYVSRGLVRAPVGRGASARWEYPHLLDVLAVRLAQHDGVALDEAAQRREGRSDTVLEREVASRLGAVTMEAAAPPLAPRAPPGEGWRRLPLGPGCELHLADDHPRMQDPVRLAALLADVARILSTSDPES